MAVRVFIDENYSAKVIFVTPIDTHSGVVTEFSVVRKIVTACIGRKI